MSKGRLIDIFGIGALILLLSLLFASEFETGPFAKGPVTTFTGLYGLIYIITTKLLSFIGEFN